MAPSESLVLRRLVQFGVVSGLGLGLDFVVFSVLIHVHATPFLANAIGAFLAVTWVYVASVRRIFQYGGASLRGCFVMYVAYQVIGIVLASWVIDGLVQFAGVLPLLAKVVVTPCTFVANYLFMTWLTRNDNT